jgi:protoporphyrinogen/coproporphyrinogen III oxidase
MWSFYHNILENAMADRFDSIIIGGGITGLTAAWKRRKRRICLIEKTNRCGGWIQTQRAPYLFEKGPRALRIYQHDHQIKTLFKDLGIEHELIYSSKKAKKRYVYDGHGVVQVPTSLLGFGQSPFRHIFSGLVSHFLHSQRNENDDESIASFFDRSLTKNCRLKLIDPVVRGIYASNPDKLSMKSCFPTLWQYSKQSSKWLTKALISFTMNPEKPSTVTFKHHGLSRLCSRLEEELSSIIRLKTSIQSIKSDRNGCLIETNGKQCLTNELICTAPQSELNGLFGALFPNSSIPYTPCEYTSVTLVQCVYPKGSTLVEGFGYLVPSIYNDTLLGVSLDSSIFDHNEQDIDTITIMLKGIQTDATCEQILNRDVMKHLHIKKRPQHVEITRLNRCLPVFRVGWESEFKQFRQLLNQKNIPVIFCGMHYGTVSMRDSINAVMTKL